MNDKKDEIIFKVEGNRNGAGSPEPHVEVLHSAERWCPEEEYRARLGVAQDAIGEVVRAYDIHEPACPRYQGGECACGLLSIFSNSRLIASVDVLHQLREVLTLN